MLPLQVAPRVAACPLVGDQVTARVEPHLVDREDVGRVGGPGPLDDLDPDPPTTVGPLNEAHAFRGPPGQGGHQRRPPPPDRGDPTSAVRRAVGRASAITAAAGRGSAVLLPPVLRRRHVVRPAACSVIPWAMSGSVLPPFS